ncbi:MAG TPA: hypothetical protein VMM84_06610, partial [Pyrinomonadaceae bacterium]|nr:hypothetical protein [Pyrinomonadaceae bacterium]
ITDTPASVPPRPGSPGILPAVADDNRFAVLSDDGRIIAFESTRNLVPDVGNEDGGNPNPEIFFYNRNSSSFIQVTDTETEPEGIPIFNQNINISSDASVFAFISNANLVGENEDETAEIYIANFNGATVSNLKQITNSSVDVTFATVNLLSPGRRLSRDGAFLALESLAENPAEASSPKQPFHAMFVYNVGTDTFTQVGPRPAADSFFGDVFRFPTFTDYNGLLQPGSLVFTSALNFRPDGTFPSEEDDSEGLNPNRVVQLFATQIPASGSNTFTRLTNNPVGQSFGGFRGLASETRRRITFSVAGVELGGGNPDFSGELYYLLTPSAVAESEAELSFFTGASNLIVPSPDPSASPTPTPSPSPGTGVGLAPGELSILRSTVGLAPANTTASGGSEETRSPALPVELNGVSLAINGAAAGLYFVGDSPQQINFVMPLGVEVGTADALVNNNGTVLRGTVAVVDSQPDLFTTTNDAGGRAIVFNITNPLARTGEPFSVTSLDENGDTVATVLELNLTGVRGAQRDDVTVTIGETVLSGAAILEVRSLPNMPGFDIIIFRLPESLAGAGDVPIFVTVTRGGSAVSSRSDDTAPNITIN